MLLNVFAAYRGPRQSCMPYPVIFKGQPGYLHASVMYLASIEAALSSSIVFWVWQSNARRD